MVNDRPNPGVPYSVLGVAWCIVYGCIMFYLPNTVLAHCCTCVRQCEGYTGFPHSCNNTVQASLRTRKIANGKFDLPQP